MRRHLSILFYILFPAVALASSADVQLLKQARSQIGIINGELQQRVASEVVANGPENALDSCRLQLEAIAQRLSANSGWEIRRVSFNARNSANLPDAWENEVLQLFERRKAEGVDMQSFEFAKLLNHEGRRVFRYMKPIIVKDSCLTCHGEQINETVAASISEKYPQDRAAGLKKGDLRGAFSLMKILPGEPL